MQMKKYVLVVTLAFILLATPVFAKSENANNANSHSNTNNGSEQRGNSEEARDAHAPQVLGASEDHKPTSTVTPSVTPSENEDNNEDVNTQALEDITATPTPSVTQTPCDPEKHWKNHGEYVSCVAHQHLGGKTVSEAAHSDIGKKDHDGEPTPSPITSAQPTLGGGTSPLNVLGDLVGKLFGFLKHLI